jgi:hypothetical protein
MPYSFHCLIGALPALALSACLAGCAAHTESDPSVDATIRKYEQWLDSRQLHYSSVGKAWSESDVIFVTDRRARPQSGLSVVRLKGVPDRELYVYDDQTTRLVAAAFSEGLAAVVIPVGRWAYIDQTGRFAFAPQFRHANRFDRGVATALLGSSWMLLQKDGSMKRLDPSIANIRDFSGDFAAFSSAGGSSGYIDHTGAIAIPASFRFAQPFCADGNAVVRTPPGWGLIDRRGSFIVNPDYEDLRCFSDGLAAAKRGKWGFISSADEFVISPQFDRVGDFSDGLAPFESRSWPHGRQFVYVSAYGFIDRAGSVVIPPKYAAVNPFNFGIAKVGTQKINWLIYPISYIVPASPYYISWKYIDKTGKTIAESR